jgi:hypothetical protein
VVRAPSGRFAEEERSRQPSIFSVLRALVALFQHPDEPYLGLYGAFGYDLAFRSIRSSGAGHGRRTSATSSSISRTS